jgi:hypothetical protein
LAAVLRWAINPKLLIPRLELLLLNPKASFRITQQPAPGVMHITMLTTFARVIILAAILQLLLHCAQTVCAMQILLKTRGFVN